MKFHIWLERREGIGSKVMAMALPMGGALAGGAAGLAASGGNPAVALGGWMAGKKIGTGAAEKFFPKSTTDLMKK